MALKQMSPVLLSVEAAEKAIEAAVAPPQDHDVAVAAAAAVGS